MNILVTGGAGFIGSNIAKYLASNGDQVTVYDDFLKGESPIFREAKNNLKIVKASILDQKALGKAFNGVEYVIHQAAIPSVPRSVEDPVGTSSVNIIGTLNVLDTARKSDVKRVVLASSSSVYGDSETLPKVETMYPKPLSPYATAKLCNEIHAKQFYSLYGLETICLRYFNVFGPGQDPDSQYAAVIPRFILALMNNRQPTIYGDGKQSRDFTYIDNVISANVLSLRAGKKAVGECYNIAGGSRITLEQLLEKLNALLGKGIKPVWAEQRKGDIKHSYADISKARKFLNYVPEHSFDDGLKKTVEWFSGHYGK